MLNKTIILILFLFSAQIQDLYGQNYGNEWIVPSQPYVKFKVAKKGVYKLNFFTIDAALQEFNVSLQAVNPKKIQIFRNGVEIPIHVEGENDGLFDFDDFVEFVGDKNDGTLDAELYDNPNDQPHKWESFISDTACYYLTVSSSSSNGLRFNTYSNTNFSAYTPESYYIEKSVKIFKDVYSQGKAYPVADKDFYYSEQVNGEGWVGNYFGLTGNASDVEQIFNVNSDNYNPIGPEPKLELKIYGGSDYRGGFNVDHKLNISISKDGVNRNSYTDTSFESFGEVKRKYTLLPGQIGSASTYVHYTAKYISNVFYSVYKPSYISLEYPRFLELNGNTKFNYALESSPIERLLVWKNYGDGTKKKPYVYDLINNIRIKAIKDTSVIKYIIPDVSKNSECFISDSTDFAWITKVKAVKMTDWTTTYNQAQFLMVIHAAFDGDEADEYVNYRKTSYTVLKVLVNDLYESFSFGIEHPLAIRKFCKLLLDKSTIQKPEFLFLVGRGYQIDMLRSNPSLLNKNFMPAIGVPASDIMFTSGLSGTVLEPAIPTGRINLEKKSDLMNYLNKVKSFEKGDYNLWRKNIMHLAGGNDANETRVIKNTMDDIGKIAKNSSLAPTITTYARSATTLNDPELKNKCIKSINEGQYLITFFGHGSTSVLDIDMGDTFNYYNYDKYSICYFNGCQVGNPALGFDGTKLFFADKMLRAKDKAAVAFLGQTYYSELFTLREQMFAFYNTMFSALPGTTLGQVHKTSTKNYMQPASPYNRSACRQLLLQADPALKLFVPELPDYSINTSSIFITPQNTNALSDSFKLGIIIENKGKYIPDTFEIEVKRRLPDNINVIRTVIKAWGIRYKDTVYVTYKTKDRLTQGTNYFSVDLNFDRFIKEWDYTNNTVENQGIFIPGNGLSIIYPRRFAIVPTDTVEIVAQSADYFLPNEQFEFEIDTNYLFNSPWKKNSGFVNSTVLVKQKFKLLQTDSQVYYIRGRVNVGQSGGGVWEERSFTMIKNHPIGWTQRVLPQLSIKSRNEYSGVFDQLLKRYDFAPTGLKLFVDCQYANNNRKGVKIGGYGAQDLNYGTFCTDGVYAMLFNPNTLNRMLLDTSLMTPQCEWGRKWPPYQSFEYQAYYTFNLSTPSEQADFAKFINLVPDSTYVVLFSSRFSFADKWGPSVKQSLHKIGCNIMDTVSSANAIFCTIGKKGASTAYDGLAHKTTSDIGYATTEGVIVGKATTGYINSEVIGPVSKWGVMRYHYNFSETNPLTDKIKFQLYTIGHNGADSLIINDVNTSPFDLSSIDAKQFPYLKMSCKMSDNKNFTAPQLRSWTITYDEVPEGSLYPLSTLGYKFHNDSLYQGDTLVVNIPFKNISVKDFPDSMRVYYRLYNRQTRVTLDEKTFNAKPLPVGDQFYFSKKWPTTFMQGKFALFYSVNPGQVQPELTLFNNAYTLNFQVQKDVINPILDVTFDGRHIMDGEIVSNNPMILISSKDENKYLMQNDTSLFSLLLQYPNSSVFKKIKLDGTDAIFYPASGNENRSKVEFRPLNLPDGTYVLKVQSKDVAGNPAGAFEYQITFVVESKATVTNFYPYPNPFSSSMRFVFTLTGTEPPSDINIKIMTFGGKVVREINKQELGNIHIGNNISDFVWDGTDQFGDKLANGVYLYKVTVKNNGEQLELRQSAGDDAFKNDIGKIYILR